MAGGRAQRRARRPKPSAGELLTEIIPEQRGAGAGAGGVAAARRGQAGEGEADGFSTARNREWVLVGMLLPRLTTLRYLLGVQGSSGSGIMGSVKVKMTSGAVDISYPSPGSSSCLVPRLPEG